MLRLDLQGALRRIAFLDADFVMRSFASAIAMGIYSLEIHLKVRICQKLNLQHCRRPFEIHDLEGLLVIAGFSRDGIPRRRRREELDRLLISLDDQ